MINIWFQKKNYIYGSTQSFAGKDSYNFELPTVLLVHLSWRNLFLVANDGFYLTLQL